MLMTNVESWSFDANSAVGGGTVGGYGNLNTVLISYNFFVKTYLIMNEQDQKILRYECFLHQTLKPQLKFVYFAVCLLNLLIKSF